MTIFEFESISENVIHPLGYSINHSDYLTNESCVGLGGLIGRALTAVYAPLLLSLIQFDCHHTYSVLRTQHYF
jgi:hypothetical protein